MKKWLEVITDSIFIVVLGCSVTGALAAMFHIIRNWRVSWIIW